MSYRPVLLTLLLGPAIAAAQDPSAADLAVQARSILEKRCARCHTDPKDRSTLVVLDHPALTAAATNRPLRFISANDPAASQALDLIEDGSMPPGAHPKVTREELETLRKWVATGAVAYPKKFDDEFAHAAILADVKRLKAHEVATARYLTLHHFAATAPTELAKTRKTFLTGMKDVLQANSRVTPVDPTDTIFRIDLDAGGWHYKPFVRLDAKGKTVGIVEHDLYDLVLLEYPHAVIPEGSEAFDELATKFLFVARQVRPIAFVRGDWFLKTATASELTKDLRLLMKRFGKVPPGLDDPNKAVSIAPAAGLPASGVSLAALDAWYGADDPPGPKAVKDFEAETIDPKSNAKRTVFYPDDVFTLRIRGTAPAHVQYVYVETKGTVADRTVVEALPAKGQLDSNDLPGKDGFAADYGFEKLKVYAAPDAFPPGDLWRAKIDDGEIERYVHPFFRLKPDGGRVVVDLTDAQVARKTVTIEVARKK